MEDIENREKQSFGHRRNLILYATSVFNGGFGAFACGSLFIFFRPDNLASFCFEGRSSAASLMDGGRSGHTCSHAHHDHDHDEAGGEAWALFEQVDTNALICLNEAQPDSLKNVLRPWYKRCDPTLPTLKSDADEQLLMCIPFISPVKIKSICIIGAGDVENPSHMKAYLNDEVLDFSSVEGKRPIQEWDLTERNVDGVIEYPTKYTKFQNVTKLWLFISANFGADFTEIRYIGLKGEYTKYKREAVNTVYESRPLKAAEDVKSMNTPRMGM